MTQAKIKLLQSLLEELVLSDTLNVICEDSDYKRSKLIEEVEHLINLLND